MIRGKCLKEKEKNGLKRVKKLYDYRMRKGRKLLDEYRFPGFRPMANVKGVFGDPRARVITLQRAQKKRYTAVAVQSIEAIMTRRYGVFVIFHVGMLGYI